MARPLIAQTEQVLTPAQAMYDILSSYGFVNQKVDFARIVEVHTRNIYSYLGDPQTDKERGFIAASVEKLHGWAWAIKRQTGIEIEIKLLPGGELLLTTKKGRVRNGAPVHPVEYRTSYNKFGHDPVRCTDDKCGCWGFRTPDYRPPRRSDRSDDLHA